MEDELLLLDVFVPGTPVPQGSLAQGRNGHLYWSNSKTLRPWRKAMTDVIEAFMPRDLDDGYDDGVRVILKFYHKRPASVKRKHKITAGDLDKLTRAALDSLTDSKIITDDSRVVALDVTKEYDDLHAEGVIIQLYKMR
jgi:Holliday junction resolvase RusA-like endonuclease